ncbi:glutamate receptor 1-like [Diachasma alloeum]|uniref:Ionotropic receptor 113 n=1 Tax=Diachasma alloeum TaxID=454923 RepID=A0A4E0RJT3_9HYME|nr:glutamate receptor 1-like [Diachasma alloeum]THK33012.1 ionotropic receptor 113 [Diachasma alloeum]
MKLFISLELYLTGIYVFFVAGNDTVVYYTSLFESVHDTYGTAGIIIASSTNYQSPARLTTWHETCTILSDKGIPTAFVSFANFKVRLKFYTRRTVRPLAVVLMRKIEDVHIFEGIAKKLDMSYPVWLLIFTKDADESVCEFCRHPHRNLFNLRFNSEILISCCDSNVIREWWSKARNFTHATKIGEWIGEDRGIRWATNQSLYSRRHFFVQPTVRVSIVRGSSYIWEKNGELDGYLGEILKELSLTMNFTISALIKEPYYGSYDPKTSKWTGVIGRIVQHEADMGASEFTLSHERINVVDFTIPIAIGDCRLYVKKLDGARLQWNAYFGAFKADVWALIIGSIIVTPIVLTVIKYTKKRRHAFSMAIEHYLYVWGIYCQQGLSEFPDETALRILYVSIFISALVVSAAYSASLTSFLTVASIYLPFNSMEEFANDGRYKLIVLQDSADYDMFKMSNETIMKKMMSLMKPSHSLPQTILGGLQQVCTRKVAFYTNEALKRTLNKNLPCDIVSIKTGKIETLGMIMSRHSEYMGIVNYHIQRFKDNGMLMRLQHKYIQQEDTSEGALLPVGLGGIAPILFVLIIGFFVAFCIFLVEIIFPPISDKLFKRKKRRLNGQNFQY